MAVARGLRRAFHKFGENARDIKSYVSLVPKSAGFGAGGLICGGMNIILKAAERYVVMDEHLESGLRGIKEAMVHKAYENKRHEPDRRMHQLISELFAIIFAVLESLLRWVHHQGTGKALLGAMLHPETFGQDLAKLIAQLKCKTGTLEKHGINLEMRETKRLMHSIKGTVEKSDAGLQRLVRGGKLQLEKLEDIRLGQEKNTAQVGAVGEAVGQEGAATRAQIRDLEYKLDQMAKSLSGARVVHNIFVLISQDPPQTRVKGQDRGGGVGVPLTARAAAQRATKRITQRQAPAAEPRIDAADVLAAVGFDAELTRVDGRSILRAARLSARDDQLVAEMTGHVRLQAFVEVPSSAVLFIEGGPNRQHEARGAISVVAAHVAAALARGRSANPLSVYALTHFCSEHRSRHDELGGTAMALVVTLLLQLIDQHRDFDTALLRECRDAVMNAPQEPTEDDVRACCDVLQRCVRALPREATLFCIVEGIAFFEGPKKRTAQTRVVLQRLLELASDEGQEGRARIKCLFTTPARSPEFIGLFKPYDVWTADAVNSSGFVPSLRRNSSWMVGRRR
ncbi:hypothetical protein B0T24DRAFT_406056 [Lasiosphaeria ovina]|uniref:Uncharacterized protein n=1 Tax=Lasiosphaeria ovina TaxID=92902 RepID=A0AAE0JX46_9PEZI|nr:hypothetical protein B0T24DRAFT_406056 [Lasiosphaeria ovina]